MNLLLISPWDPYDDRFQLQENRFLSINHPLPAFKPLVPVWNVARKLTPLHWRNVGEPASKQQTTTLQSTTQRGIRYYARPFTRRFRTAQAQLSHRLLRVPVYSDTLFSEVTSVRGNTCAQIFVTDQGHARVFPMASKI